MAPAGREVLHLHLRQASLPVGYRQVVLEEEHTLDRASGLVGQ